MRQSFKRRPKRGQQRLLDLTPKNCPVEICTMLPRGWSCNYCGKNSKLLKYLAGDPEWREL